ncbi:hypothetical protein [Microbispora siamensis]|uniref:Uncharacterized protein n=1 Tax=Microbispora siamensis TaxID=564413 RepID=A0ABQ4H1N5_9ACTN|nr:hypothetical protein [Microbispora siamensis]GIH67558.1 hypothetical protein Msi02_83750 [Microbispora siamensis]
MSDGVPEWRGRRPSGVDDTTINALGKLADAMGMVQRARGHLYAFHQLTGGAHERLSEAIKLLQAAGHDAQAETLSTELLGLDVLPGRWTFQVVEEYDDGYYRCFVELEQRMRDELASGRRNILEAELKERNQG